MTICSECASRLGYIPKDGVVGIWKAECDFCHEVKPVCDCAHDYWPPMKQRNCDIFSDVRSALLQFWKENPKYFKRDGRMGYTTPLFALAEWMLSVRKEKESAE